MLVFLKQQSLTFLALWTEGWGEEMVLHERARVHAICSNGRHTYMPFAQTELNALAYCLHKYTYVCSLAHHFCSLVPNELWPGSVPRPGVGEPFCYSGVLLGLQWLETMADLPDITFPESGGAD